MDKTKTETTTATILAIAITAAAILAGAYLWITPLIH